MDKKVLIVTYYWPPSGGGGVQRWLKFAKYLPDFGWEPIIFTPENPQFDQVDESLLEDVDPQLEVLKFPIWEPYHLFKKITGKRELKQGQVLEDGDNSFMKKLSIWLRGNLFIPDPRRFWIKPSVEYLNGLVKSNNIKTIISTGPPHSMHLIGMKVKMANPTINWVADFRDPWSEWDILHKFSLTKFSLNKHKALEQKVLKTANHILTVSENWKSDFERLGARRASTITNGYDSEDITASHSRMDKFRVCHLGMLNDFRNPEVFWQALTEILEANENFREDFELSLVGILSEKVSSQLEQNELLKPRVVLQDYVAHSEVNKVYTESSVLLLILNDSTNAKGHLPGKLFEYLAASVPIIGIGDTNGDASKILEDTRSGRY